MVKKIFLVFNFSILTQLISIFAISYITKKNVSNDFIEKIALLESGFYVITSILAFGILQIATRDISINSNWQSIVAKTQNIRISFGLILSVIGVLCYFLTGNNVFLLLLMAPLISYNVNYALYAKGLSIYATIASCLRILIPSITLLIFGFFNYFSETYYTVIFAFSILISGYLTYVFLKINYKFVFKQNFYKKYISRFKIGLTDIAIVFLESGILFFAAFFYDKYSIANSYLILKIYILIKGVQRLVFQIFYNELTDEIKVRVLNKIIFVIGFVFFITSTFYGKEFLSLMFSNVDNYLIINFKILGFSILLASIILASMARSLVLKKDKIYFESYILSLISAFLCMLILSFTEFSKIGIAISLLIGEAVLFASFFVKIYKDFKIKNYFVFIAIHGFLLCNYLFFKIYFSNNISILITFIVEIIYIVIFLLLNKKQLL
ncbi:hypothetical protein [Confluentibacter lentus]|uniref:hypothetical protein n=1 Tax=Confluentibacter lentus TaxID=1699412 RepID=UPI000C295056|nr:hypothetical protein [Confluentibacter lentus]